MNVCKDLLNCRDADGEGDSISMNKLHRFICDVGQCMDRDDLCCFSCLTKCEFRAIEKYKINHQNRTLLKTRCMIKKLRGE